MYALARAITMTKLPFFEYICKHQLYMDGSEKKYYKISEVSVLLDVPASTLRFWESEFGNLRPKRNARGTRFYSQADMERLQIIKYLVKDRGLHIEAAKKEMRNNPKGMENTARAVARLKEIRATLCGMLEAFERRH